MNAFTCEPFQTRSDYVQKLCELVQFVVRKKWTRSCLTLFKL